jgi:hypothetical protein
MTDSPVNPPVTKAIFFFMACKSKNQSALIIVWRKKMGVKIVD